MNNVTRQRKTHTKHIVQTKEQFWHSCATARYRNNEHIKQCNAATKTEDSGQGSCIVVMNTLKDITQHKDTYRAVREHPTTS